MTLESEVRMDRLLSDKLNQLRKQAQLQAGVLADAAIALVGGQGLNNSIQGATFDQITERAKALRDAAESYNSTILAIHKIEHA